MDEKKREGIFREYARLEDEFLLLAEYIPLTPNLDDPNYQFGSPRAAAFGLDCCTWLETLMLELLGDSRLDDFPEIKKIRRKRNKSMDVYREVFEKKFVMSTGGYKLRYSEGDEIRPFAAWAKGKNPEWFRVYSKYKHDRFALADMFTMGHALEAFLALSIVMNHWDWYRPLGDQYSSKVFEGLGL
jgi:hypothetical protein